MRTIDVGRPESIVLVDRMLLPHSLMLHGVRTVDELVDADAIQQMGPGGDRGRCGRGATRS